MEIKRLFKKDSPTQTEEFFLALEIHDSLVKTASWKVVDNQPEIIAVGSYEAWEDSESLVNGVDISLTNAVKTLGSEPDRVILGLPESWLDGDKISTDYSSQIKKIINDLNLKPIGLVTITEAIVQQLKKQDGIPPTAILIEIYPTRAVVSLIRVGQVERQEEVGRSDDLAKDVEEALVRIGADRLPVRFILTNGSNLDNERQQIISYPWLEKLNFLHLPKVEVLDSDFSIKAIALCGGTEAAKSLGLDVVTTPTTEDGTIASSDVTPVNEATLKDLGFEVESENKSPEIDSTPPLPPTPLVIHQPEPQTSLKHRLIPSLSLPRLRLPQLSLKYFFLIGVPIIPAILFLFYQSLVRAEITIKTKPESLEQTVTVNLSKDQAGSAILREETLTVNVEKKISTTGETVVGDKAKGTITIYNRSSQLIALKAGTKVTASNGQDFSLDDSVFIASSSSQPEPPFVITPGSSAITVSALKIGAESNLPKDTQFSVDKYPKSTLIAICDKDFSGGSSKTVKAVSDRDIKSLEEQALAEVSTKVNSESTSNDNESKSVSGDIKITTKKFSAKISEASDELSLNLSASVPVLVYSPENLINNLTKQIVSGKYSQKKLDPTSTTIVLNDIKKITNDSYTASAAVQGQLVPDINVAQYPSVLAGKSVSKIPSLFDNTSGVSSIVVKITPSLPILNQYLPRNPARIKIIIVSNQTNV